MVLLNRVAEYFAPGSSPTSTSTSVEASHYTEGNTGPSGGSSSFERRLYHGDAFVLSESNTRKPAIIDNHISSGDGVEDIGDGRAAYPHVILAGGLGGLTGDMLMHSLDTVKTRQQGDPHRPPKYHTLGNTYYTILRQEGIPRGLYGGVTPAAIGSFIGTSIFFGTYEWSKRAMLDMGIAPSIAYLNAGLVADLAASPLYVPTEVLKTRLQLQGRYNNPYFHSGYNYRSTMHATRVMAKTEGFSAFFHGYRATLYRDLPFSALQFAFYEKEREFAKWWVGSKDIGTPLEILTGATAGGMAGIITCPLDVVKTRIQTQVHNPPANSSSAQPTSSPSSASKVTNSSSSQTSSAASVAARSSAASRAASSAKRHISTSSPSTTFTKPGSVMLDTSSVMTGLRIIYQSEGVAGLFRGVGPRGVWTSVQSGTMLVLYQALLRRFEEEGLIG